MRRGVALIPTRVICCRALLASALAVGLAAPGMAAQADGQIAATGRFETPVGMHSMLYLNTPFSAMKAMFGQAAAMGASDIRVNIEVSTVFPGPAQGQGRQGPVARLVGRNLLPLAARGRNPAPPNPLAHPHWAAVDEYIRLARRYHMNVLAVLTSTPAWMAACPQGTSSSQLYRCPPGDPGQWGRAVGEIAKHVRQVIDRFEILNEPDGRWSFLGTPQQYAALLASSYDAIHAVDPPAQVVLGGLMSATPGPHRWMDRMLATPGVDALRKFDVANIHLRLPPGEMGGAVCQWRTYLASRGFEGPLWVTETGYPADRSAQTDPGYEDGPKSQARWLTTVIPAMLAYGAQEIFVTERDLSGARFGSEGVLQTPNPLPAWPPVRRRPSFYAMQRLDRGGWVPAELRYSRQATVHGGQGGSSGGC